MSSDRDTSSRDFGAELAFDALADPIRREILGVLAESEETSAGALAERIHRVGRTAVSTHLRVLRVAGLVTERREGRYRYYSIDPSGAATEVIGLLHGLFRESLREARSGVEGRAGSDRDAEAG